VPDLARIRSALAAHAPALLPLAGQRQAAVAVALADGAHGPELLFIERAEHPEDPWSGHMAFPGGRVDPGDPSPQAAAERETAEEVGLDLAGAERIGRLDDLEGRNAGRPAGLVISAFVYHVPAPPPLRPNYEVREALWVPVARLLEPARHVDYRHRRYGDAFPPYPGIVVGDPERQVIWGLTYRFLEIFFARIGAPLPDRWSELRRGAG
jgi:8-oxo-dGTP pyrophosphatase MutT (NUDIX family)